MTTLKFEKEGWALVGKTWHYFFWVEGNESACGGWMLTTMPELVERDAKLPQTCRGCAALYREVTRSYSDGVG